MVVAQHRQTAEMIAGLAVCFLLLFLLYSAVSSHDKTVTAGAHAYQLRADFDHIDGLDRGADVKLAGIPVGKVDAESVNPKNYKAEILFHVRPDIQLSTDTAAIITSDSLMSDKYLSLFPGGDDKMLHSGDKILQTQGSIGIEQLLSKFLMSMTQTLSQIQKNQAQHTTSPIPNHK